MKVFGLKLIKKFLSINFPIRLKASYVTFKNSFYFFSLNEEEYSSRKAKLGKRIKH